MLRTGILCFVFATSLFSPAHADGLMLPVDENYPKDFLRNRVTEVSVTVNGLVAETSVYQEFINESDDSTDAVYSFPLPPEARATNFVYWYGGKIFKAVLKVREQATNPGTGEGGVAAEVNEYIGRNGIKIRLQGIGPREVQKVRLDYISFCEYYRGKSTYRYPLETGDFVTHQLEHIRFSFSVKSNATIVNHGIPTHTGYRVVNASADALEVEMIQPKAYLDRDLQFWYEIDQSRLGVDFYSVANDSTDGHFTLFVRPENEGQASSILPKRVFFLLSNASGMVGYKLTQSILAISRALDQLKSSDFFNIVLFNNDVSAWQNVPVTASAENIQTAKDYLSSISGSGGSRMDLGLEECLAQIQDGELNNSILVFTDGRSPLDPRAIEALNDHKAGIFPIGVGNNLDRSRLEMTASLNYGFVTYLETTDNLSEKMLQVFNQISEPILEDTRIEYGRAGITQTLPEKIPTTYAGSYFFTTGRYSTPGLSSLSIAGKSTAGVSAFDFQLDFSSQNENNRFTESIWAKETIDAIEREIEIYEETPELKATLIDLSLKYNIRCRYTAYVADYETEDGDLTSVETANNTNDIRSISFISGNYPNPFNPSTKIRFFIHSDDAAGPKLLRIYNVRGRLVTVIDVSHVSAGWHIIEFFGRDILGNPLPSGIYFVQLMTGRRTSNVVKINLVK